MKRAREIAACLVKTERQLGPRAMGVPRRQVSILDERSPAELRKGGMQGNDRMSADRHGFASLYGSALAWLEAARGESPGMIVEVGVLRGHGLALWRMLYPSARVLGLDIDLSHFHEHEPELRRKLGLQVGWCEVQKFDQLTDGTSELLNAIGAFRAVDVLVDDGLHSPKAIQNTAQAVLPLLAPTALYIVEDCKTGARDAGSILRELNSVQHNGLGADKRGALAILKRGG
jgi:hypothetical protein